MSKSVFQYCGSLLLVLVSQSALTASFQEATTLQENTRWDHFFAKESVKGVLLLCKGSSLACVTNDRARAVMPFIPASTFKIPHALIALETGVVSSELQIFKWDGKPRDMALWQQDFTLRGAMQASAVPVFQQFARQIGSSRMQEYLDKFAYGNRQMSGEIDRFWLDGPLRISALEQVAFLESLYHNRLSAAKQNQLIVKDALVAEATSEYLLRAKSGYTGIKNQSEPGIAWWVGWVEKGTEVTFFAFNMDVTDAAKLSARKSIPLEIMQTQGDI